MDTVFIVVSPHSSFSSPEGTQMDTVFIVVSPHSNVPSLTACLKSPFSSRLRGKRAAPFQKCFVLSVKMSALCDGPRHRRAAW